MEDTPVKMVLAHIEKEPRPLHKVRPDVPTALSDVVAKMLAKAPAQRYQTPVEVARALAPFVKASGKPGAVAGASLPEGAASVGPGTRVSGNTSRVKPLPHAAESRESDKPGSATESPFTGLNESSSRARRAAPRAADSGSRKRGGRAWLLAAAGGVALLLAIILVIKFTRPDGSSTENRTESHPEEVAQGTSTPRQSLPPKTPDEPVKRTPSPDAANQPVESDPVVGPTPKEDPKLPVTPVDPVLGGKPADPPAKVETDPRPETARGPRRCIILWMGGGPSQLDTFDLKPGKPNGGPFHEIDTRVKGVRISENLPLLAKHTDRLAIIRSLSHNDTNHESASFLMHTGRSSDTQTRWCCLVGPASRRSEQ